jgi:DNA-binding FrmR family transcriptional regulator
MSEPVAKRPRHDTDKVINRLKRVEGQVRGLQRMVAEEAHCEDILTQLSATRAALDRVGIFLITHQVRECLLDEGETSSEAAVQRALETFQKYAQHLQTPQGVDPF